MAKSTVKATKNVRLAANDDAKAKAFEEFLNTMHKNKPGEVLRLDDNAANVEISSVPTGAISLDVALGCGGFPRGRIIELYGPEMSGKTSLALSVAAECQKINGKVGFVDAEHALSRSHALNMGVDPHSLVIYQPSSGEDGLDMTIKMCESNAFDIVIIDSVAALTPQAEIDGEMGDILVGAHARLMSKGLRKLASLAAETGTMLIFINQIRMKIGSYGNPETTTGGNALRFFASVRIEVRSSASKKITQGTTVIGQQTTATVRKNKCGPPHRVAEYDLHFDSGIQSEGALLDVAEMLGVITRKGGSYTETLTGERIGVGKENVKTILAGDKEQFERIKEGVYSALRANAAHVVVLQEEEDTPEDVQAALED